MQLVNESDRWKLKLKALGTGAEASGFEAGL